MKNIKTIWFSRLAVVLAVATSATACLKEDILGVAEPVPQGEMIRFDIQRGWDDDEITRSSDNEYGKFLSKHLLVSEDKSQSIEMGAYQQSIDSWFEPETRGTMVQADAFNEFMAFGYKTSGTTTTQMFNTYHQKDGGMWEKPVGAAGTENANGYFWPGSEYTCSFFGIAMSDNKLSDPSFTGTESNYVKTTKNDAGQIVSFDYTVPDAAVDQPDIMVASATNLPGDGSRGVTLDFKHILTAVNIKVGTATGENISSITVNSIIFNNVYAKAAYTIETGAWTNATFYDVKESFKVDFNGYDSGEGSYSYQSGSGSIMNGTAATLMMIPQTLRNDATVTVSYTITHTNGSKVSPTATANIGGSMWEQGKSINYILNIDNSDGVQFLTQDTYADAHYVILPLNIKYQNESQGLGEVTLRAIDKATNSTASWVQFRNSLVEVENDGWWADPTEIYEVSENSEKELNTSDYDRSPNLTINSSGQCFAFLTENIGVSNREVELQLLIDNVVEDKISITQLCPTWTDTKGCERIEEGESLPWGYSWKLKEGETEYKTTINVPNGGFLNLNRLLAKIVYYIYGSPSGVTAPGFLGGNGDYTFDYTNFLNNMANADTGAGSNTDGRQNSTYMFNYAGGGSMTGLYAFLVNNFNASLTKETFEGISYTEYATKEALKKNKARVNIGSSNGQTIHNPVIEASRTDLWYLPATGEVSVLQNNANMISGVETMMNTGDIFWTSTASETPKAYSYTFGGSTQEADRDNAYRVRAIRSKATTAAE